MYSLAGTRITGIEISKCGGMIAFLSLGGTRAIVFQESFIVNVYIEDHISRNAFKRI